MDYPLNIHAFKYSKKRRRYEKNGVSFDPVTKTAISCGVYVFVKEIDGELYIADHYAQTYRYSSRIARNHRNSVFSLMRSLGIPGNVIRETKHLYAANTTGLDDLQAALLKVPEWHEEEKNKLQNIIASLAISQMLDCV